MPRPKTIKLDVDVRDVLASAEYVRIGTKYGVQFSRELSRELYVRVNKVLNVLGGYWNTKVKAHLFENDPREALRAALAEGGEIVDTKKSLGQFFTPAPLAEHLVRSLASMPTETMLEPSSGAGAIARAWRKFVGPYVTCVEKDPKLARELESDDFDTHCGDFLAFNERPRQGGYDVVAMNPPFLGNEAVKHILHAYELLLPGGRLAAIAPTGAITGRTKLHQQLNALIAQSRGSVCGGVEELPDDSFAEVGTKVRTVIVRLCKPVM